MIDETKFEELESMPLYKTVYRVVTGIAIKIPAGISLVILAVIASKIFGRERVKNAFQELMDYKESKKGK